MLVARALGGWRGMATLCLRFTFARQRLIQFSPLQVSFIHSKAKPKALPLIKSDKHHYTVCILGLPNSGKSTLFNTICGEHLALTDSIPGMTRDRKEAIIWNGLVKLVDTGGLETGKSHEDSLKQVHQSYMEADKVLFVVDGKKGINEEEMIMGKYLKRFGEASKVVLVVNKMEGVDESELDNDVFKLGFKEIRYVSGEHGDGVLELMQEIDGLIPVDIKKRNEILRSQRKDKFKGIMKEMRQEIKKGLSEDVKFDFRAWDREFKRLNPDPEENSELDQDECSESFMRPEQSFTQGRGVGNENPFLKKPIQIAIVGRPNVGKSSLINKLLGQDRMAVSERPHTTTDSISNDIEYKGRKIKLVDTAGLASSNFDSNEEHLKKVQIATMNHVKFSHVVVYMLDSNSSFRILDFTFIKRIIDEGRPVVLAINKWETIKPEYRKKALAFINKQIETHLGELNGPPLVTVSAIMEEGITNLMDSILKMYDQWNLRVSTGMLNNWLEKFKKLDNLPIDGCEQLRIRFLVQAKVRPPTFIVFANDKDLFKKNYFQFMKQKLVGEFRLEGVPIRMQVRNSKESTSRDSKKYDSFKKRKESLKQVKRSQKLKDLKEKYGGFGKK